MKEELKYVIGGVVVLIAIGAWIVSSSPSSERDPVMDSFAQCLTENGAVMYGAYWCSHCKAQKELFGPSFDQVNYVECEENKETCLKAGIKGYPTWKFATGEVVEGQISLQSLAAKTNCPIE